MRTLVLIEAAADETGGDDAVLHRPELVPTPTGPLRNALPDLRPEVIVTSAPLPLPLARAWVAAVPAPLLLWVRVDDGSATDAGDPMPGPVEQHRLPAGTSLTSALGFAERRRSAAALGVEPVSGSWRRPGSSSPYAPAGAPHRRASAGSVLMVGAGVVNLVTASLLLRHGYAVTVLDRSPDPRADTRWTEHGCSRGGASARMFTLTEADDYHDLVRDPGADVFDRRPSEGGWNILADRASTADARWIEEFRSVPRWMATTYNEDTFAFNARSGRLWEEWMAVAPELFADVHLRHDILRLYEDPDHLAGAVHRQHGVGALLHTLSEPDVRRRCPSLAGACAGAFAGGLVVRGFTVAVHDLMDRLADELRAGGAELVSGAHVETTLLDAAGRVTGVRTDDGTVHHADHYVVSTGAYGAEPIRHTSSAGQVHGILGCWLTVPNVHPRLDTSLKVARKGHVTEDANITVSRDDAGREVLVVGSGYGYAGSDPDNIDRTELAAMRDAVGDTVERLFPDAYAAAGGPDLLRSEVRFCFRPWTASNLGLFESRPAVTGSFVVTGGNNTGGFAQAPVIAEAVLDAVTGRRHPMHVLYHPSRMARSLDRTARRRALPQPVAP